MPTEALPLEDVSLKPVSGFDLPLPPERQPSAADPDDSSPHLRLGQQVRSEETVVPPAQEPGTTTRSKEMLREANVMYASMLYTMLLSGWNDGTTGPLLPRIQLVYHV